MGKKKPKQRVTEYYTSIQYGVCHGPVERLISIRVNDKVVGKCSKIVGPVTYIDDPKLFGGIKKEGGLRGRMAWQSGTDDQLLDAYVASKKGKLPTELPGYRGIATAYFTEMPPPVLAPVETGVAGSILSGLSFSTTGLSRIFNFLNTLGPSPRKGFYWSANQPVVHPVHFRLTRVDRSWLPDIAAIPGDVETQRQAICIAIDVSMSMNTDNRIGIAKNAVVDLLREIKAAPKANTFDIRIVGWSNSLTAMQRRNCSPADYDALISFVQTLPTSFGGNTLLAVSGLEDFYSGARGKCRTFLFLTDGLPNSSQVATDAGAVLAETGAAAYAFNLVLTDTTETAKLDNTPEDGVPVINLSTAPMFLRNLFRSAITQQIDMNPAHIIRECLVNSTWGLGLPESALDSAMFEAAARTLYEERFGLSMIWARQAKVEDFIGEILSHIQATVYVNPMTGKICLKLIRNDYDAGTLDILTPSNSVITSFKRRTPAEVTNEINVTWTNPNTEQEEVITRQSLGSIVANNGEVVADNRNYYGVRRAGLAAQLCDRDLAAATAPLCTAEVKANRSFSRKVPGDVVKLTSPENGANEIIMRLMKINYGYVGSSEVELTLTEDVFSYSKARYVEPPRGSDGGQGAFPAEPTAAEVFTLNTYMNLSLADGIDDLVDPETQVGFVIATNQQDTFNAEIFQEVPTVIGGTEYESIGEFDLVGWATLTSALPPAVESELALPVPSVGPTPMPGTFAFIGPAGLPEALHEIVLVKEFNATTGLFKIQRGLMDTVPWDWPAGTPIRYLDQQMRFLNTNTATSGVAEDFRVHTITSLGILPDQLAPIVSYTPTDRLYAPSRPANVTVAGVSFGVVDGTALTSVEVTWANRNRLTEDAVLLNWNEPSVTPEAGQTTTIRIYNHETNALITEYADLSGVSHTFDTSVFGAAPRARITVLSARDGFDSIQGHEIVVDLTPFLPPYDLTFEVI